jgi:8-oxo-dGTP diphosphatase
VRFDEGLDEAAQRILGTKAQMDSQWLEQLASFGAVERDPRGRVIAVAYFALIRPEDFTSALLSRDLELVQLDIPWEGEAGGPVGAIGADGTKLALGFDHDEILGLVVKRLRGKLNYTRIGFALLGPLFTLRELQEVHQAILNISFAKPAFRRRMLDKNWIQATGKRETGTEFRPAELYQQLPSNRN